MLRKMKDVPQMALSWHSMLCISLLHLCTNKDSDASGLNRLPLAVLQEDDASAIRNELCQQAWNDPIRSYDSAWLE